MEKLRANWHVMLFTDCPECECQIDLTEYGNEQFMNGDYCGPLDQVEDVELTCPECNHEFKCDFEW